MEHLLITTYLFVIMSALNLSCLAGFSAMLAKFGSRIRIHTVCWDQLNQLNSVTKLFCCRSGMVQCQSK